MILICFHVISVTFFMIFWLLLHKNHYLCNRNLNIYVFKKQNQCVRHKKCLHARSAEASFLRLIALLRKVSKCCHGAKINKKNIKPNKNIKNMAKTIGFDLGVGSIGSAIRNTELSSQFPSNVIQDNMVNPKRYSRQFP